MYRGFASILVLKRFPIILERAGLLRRGASQRESRWACGVAPQAAAWSVNWNVAPGPAFCEAHSFSAMCFDDRAADRKSHSEPTWLGRVERVEQPVDARCVNPGA